MAGGGQDNSQWLSVTEETLFLHDGLIRVTDLVELPHDVNTVHEVDHEVVTFDSKSPTELSERLMTVCGTQNNAYARLLEYRLNALRGFWNAQHQLALEEQSERDGATHEETIALLKKQGLWKESEQASFSTRVSLLLVLPLLQSQSKFDNALCGVTAELLLNCLKDCPPLSLTKEPGDCLDGLESLLCTWLGEDTGVESSQQTVRDVVQRENAASALVALACARGHLKTFIHTVHLLQSLKDLGQLPIADVLAKLLDMEGGQGQPTSVLGSKHIVCWGVEDLLTGAEKDGASAPDKEKDKSKSPEIDIGRSISCDGMFLFTSNSTGRGLAKIGTGLHGTLRGYVYARNADLPAGWVAWGNGTLLQRPIEFDKESENTNLAQVLDPYTLKPVKTVPRPEQYSVSGAMTTISLCSDGVYFYWLWCMGSATDKNAKGQTIILDVFKYDAKENIVTPLRASVAIQRKEEGSTKSINETLLSRLRPCRSAATAATFVALTGGDLNTNRKDDTNTSCGMPLKTLLRTPVYCDGTTLVLLTPVPGGNNSSAARSLFGSGTSLASLRSLATNLCFSVMDGQFTNRSDLLDAPTCALARGAPVLGLGVCYDSCNNMLWTCCNDWVDQFFNPGHQARHLVLERLGIEPNIITTSPPDNRLPPSEVIKQILQHVGSMSLHQINNDFLHTPLCSYILEQHPVDLSYMERVCDILDKAIQDQDRRIIICVLIIFQHMFRMSTFKKEREKEVQLINRTSALVWQILDRYSSVDSDDHTESLAIQREVCHVISSGLQVLYSSSSECNNLLHKLLTEGDKVPGLKRLQNLILVDFAERLRNHTLDTSEMKHLRLSDDLVHYTLKIAVKESCVLLRECQTTDKSKFDRIQATVPNASPCLRYLMSLQSHLLRESALYKEPEENKMEESRSDESLSDLQPAVLCLASRVFAGAYEVLEVLLETCNAIINSDVEDMEYRLQGLERVAKATILGHMLPVLLTAMTHYNLRCLSIADPLMPQLVQLVVLTSQAALLLKSQVQAIRQDDLLDISTDMDIIELIGEAVNAERNDEAPPAGLGTRTSLEEEKEEQGFLAGLKIPAPWATGKTVETIHPVRDNYKFRETVHIPGARCLFLRFDPRCSSQYDYDKLVVYAGPNSSSRKVAEYGGNTFGYGSRSVLGSGWPKDLVKVDGDTVTFSFEMRSGREHNTPDKAMWGFLVTVRAQESTEEVSNGLPFLADLALGLSVLACTMLHLLYQGPEKTKDEVACQHLLKSKLLQRCVWQSEDAGATITPLSTPSPVELPIQEDTELKLPSSPGPYGGLPRIKLPFDIVQKLRALSERRMPQMRPSIKEVIQPDVLEENILSATIKHLSMSEIVRNLAEHEQHKTEEFHLLCNIVSEVYRKLSALIRQLQNSAELEHRWQTEVNDIRNGLMQQHEVFFNDFHVQENKHKELAILCFLTDIPLEVDSTNLEAAVTALREKLEADLATEVKDGGKQQTLSKTRALVAGLLERLSLLLHVTIAPECGLTRSMTHHPDAYKHSIPSVMVRSDTEVLHSLHTYTRSFSAPPEMESAQDDSILDIMKLQRKRQAQKRATSILHDLVEDEPKDRPPHVVLIDQLYSFIGSNPEKAVSCRSFLSAAQVRLKRGTTRKQALVHMKELLTAASRVGGATHLVAAVTSVLQHGPRVEELACGGMAHHVREAFAETMTSVVQLAARYPIACCNSIGLLCIIPYTRAEEKCLVRCGLVHLLDRLCSLSNYRTDSGSNTEMQSMKRKVSAMAWAGFQVLSDRCVMWEQEDEAVVYADTFTAVGAYLDELEHSGLARQVSTLLTNHLARATECSGNEAAGNEALQEVLSLLNNLSRSKMGKAILSQPGCVSKLLSLLLDQRPSPKLVLIILQLCRVALPLMSAEDCDKVELPTWGQELTPSGYVGLSDKPLKIASLLLAKLGDFLTPGDQTTISSRRPSTGSMNLPLGGSGSGGDKDKGEDTDIQDGRLSVFVHKRDDQSSHEVIQPLLSSDSRPFRLGGGANMERVVRMDREMTKTGRAEVTTEDALSARRRAAKWAQMGLVVSTGTPQDCTGSENTSSDKKKTATEVVCKEKNAELSRTDPIRPFISGHVANSMAAEVIALLHSLLTAPETLAAQTWATAVENVISDALSCLPLLLSSLDDLSSPRCNKTQVMSMAKQSNAALGALGGFEETIKPGCTVQIVGPGVHSSVGQVLSVSEQTGLATVLLEPPTDEEFSPPRYSDSVQVPLARLIPPRNEPLPLHQLSMTEAIVTAVQSLLLPQNGSGSPLSQPLPMQGDGNSLSNQICRVVAEIRTRACKVLACHLKDLSFASAFIQHSSASIDILKSLAKECCSGDRPPVIETQVQRLRMMYRDCAKPPPPPCKTPSRPAKEITWNTSRSFPPVRSCLFSHGLASVVFLGDPSAGSGLPRGTMIYATQAIPQQAPSFYWELEIVSFGDSQDDSGPIISFGFVPAAERKDGAWTNPVGSCLFHNNGRSVHYNGSSLLQWKSVRLDVTLNAGDIAGIGWEKQGDSPSLPGQQVKGLVYFTYNGRRLAATLDDVSGAMWPVVHIQKKGTRIKANFGSRPFAYAEGRQHRNAADECHDVAREIRETFGALPFHLASDSDSEGPATASTSASDTSSRDAKTPPGPPCKTASSQKALREYNSESSVHYKLLPCYENFLQTGPDTRTQAANQDDESDVEDLEDDQPMEDHYALLVKAWEQKVFPTIRRRFRNEAERKDGLEQIRGALQLGMTDIARQTVEFLYEENGGMPRDLHLPTIDDIKEELAKFTIERVRKGTTVVIRMPGGVGSAAGTTHLPKYAVRGMLKTFGLTGVVLDVDQPGELVQVETYLRSEGILVRYWYPIDMLERPPQGYRKSSIVGHQVLDTSNVHIHRELLRCESILARMHCRSALLELISQCNSPAMEVPSCSTTLGSTMAASAALLQELDVENLQLLSNELLSCPQPHGCVVAHSLLTSESPFQCLSSHTCSASDVFYEDNEKLKQELRVAVARAANQGEDYLIELSSQICLCLQTAPEMFQHEEFPVTEMKINTDVYFPGAAFLVISCKADPKATRKDTSLYKSPWARMFCYHGHRVKKSGQPSKQEVVCYPRDPSSNSNQSFQYAPVIVPGDMLHVRIGVSPPPGIIITIHALPPQFPLAVAYIETLVSLKCRVAATQGEGDGAKNVEKDGAIQGEDAGLMSPWRNFDSLVIPPPVLLHIIELIGGYLWRSDIPAVVKEFIFHLLAQSMRMMHQTETVLSNILPSVSPQLSPSLALLVQLQSELRKLYDEETKNWSPATTVSGHGIGLGVGDYGRFSTYFHSLMEMCLAISEVTAPISPGSLASNTETKVVPAVPPAPTSPVTAGKRKKLKAKRDRDRGSAMPRRNGSPRRPSESESPGTLTCVGYDSGASASSSTTSASSSSSGVSISSSKPEEMLWFHRALTMSQILRYLIHGDPQGQTVTNDAVTDASQVLSTPTSHTRLLVITGIPGTLSEENVKKSIRKACNTSGGLYKDLIYVPEQEIEIKPSIVDHPTSETQSAKPTSAERQDVPQMSGGSSGGESQSGAKVSMTEGDISGKTLRSIKGYAVIEVRSKTKVDSVRKALFKSRPFIGNLTFDPDELVDMPEEMLSVSPVNQTLFSDPQGNTALEDFLLEKLVASRQTYDLRDEAMIALTEIFHSCFISEQRVSLLDTKQESGFICLGRDQIMLQTPGNLMYTFFTTIRAVKKTFLEQVNHVLRRYGIPKLGDKDDSPDKNVKSRAGKKSVKPSKEKLAMGATAKPVSKDKKSKPKDATEKQTKESSVGETPPKSPKEAGSKEEERLLTLDGFLSYVADKTKQDTRAVWRALMACGFDIHFDRSACIDPSQAQQMSSQWTPEMDSALVLYVNSLCCHLCISPARLHPHEIYFTRAQLAAPHYGCLQGVPIESIRLRFALLQSLNNTLETFFLPLIDLRASLGPTFSGSTAALLSDARGFIFYDTKVVLMNRVLNATAQRKPDQAAPEITLDPLENVGGEKKTPISTNFCQALRQLTNISSSQLCVRLAAGGDPTYAFNVRMTGEEVHGTSGSFRHFLWQVARELESDILGLLILCPSAASQKNKGKYIMKPGPMTYSEEKLLIFLGQLLAITVRADIPLGLDLLPVFWKNLVKEELDPLTDLQEADILTYNYIKKFEMAESEDELQLLCMDTCPRFVYTMLNGEEKELIPNGKHTLVSWENRQLYVDSIRAMRMKELCCRERMNALRSGMATIIPIQLLPLMRPQDIELRTCGRPQVDLHFLKAHTMYQVGLMETDQHIEYFWNALEGFSQDELCKFIKFSCNQERIPQSCPCKDGGSETAHVPPYPMKIAPPDGPGSPDSRYIRVETCMFMIKLPQYTTQEIMTERLLYAINCREDPLSG